MENMPLKEWREPTLRRGWVKFSQMIQSPITQKEESNMTIKDIIDLGADGPRAYAPFNQGKLQDLYEREEGKGQPEPIEEPQRGPTITEVELDGIDTKDYPDFVDAFVVSCLINGRKATEEELDSINEDSGLRYGFVSRELWGDI